MAWLRVGDNITTHPAMARILSATAPADKPLSVSHEKKLAAVGVLTLLASASGAHLTDGWVEIGQIAQIAPGIETEMLNILQDAGLAERVQAVDPNGPADAPKRWMIRLDLSDPEFFHNRTKEEVMTDRGRSRDRANEPLHMTVRVRDGDQCRWCEKTVSWTDRRGARGAEIDSLNRHKDSTAETLVVSCKRCNQLRRDGKELNLKNPPENPYYSGHTIDLVNNSQWAKDHGIHLKPRQTQLDLTHADPQQHTGRAADTEGSAAPAAGPRPTGAPNTGAQAGVAGLDPDMVDAPWWVLSDDEETAEQMRAILRRHTGRAADTEGSAAPAAGPRPTGAPNTGAPDKTPPRPDVTHDNPPVSKETNEDNETVKPSKDLDTDGEQPGFLGSGRDGPGQVGHGREGTAKRRRRRRGSRGGKKATNG